MPRPLKGEWQAMVHLTDDLTAFKSFDAALPTFDIATMREHTAKHPYWVHFGAGNLFRAVHAPIAQTLLNEGDVASGVIVA